MIGNFWASFGNILVNCDGVFVPYWKSFGIIFRSFSVFLELGESFVIFCGLSGFFEESMWGKFFLPEMVFLVFWESIET